MGFAGVAEAVAAVTAVRSGAHQHLVIVVAVRGLPVEHGLEARRAHAIAAPIVPMKKIGQAGLLNVGGQRPSEADDVVNLGRLAGRDAQQVGAMPQSQIEEPGHQFLAHFLRVDGAVEAADLDAALAHAPPQLRGVGLAVAAQEAGDGLGGLDHEAELAVLIPAVSLLAELERKFDVGVTDFGAQTVRVVAVTQIVMRVRNRKELPLFLGLPVPFLSVE